MKRKIEIIMIRDITPKDQELEGTLGDHNLHFFMKKGWITWVESDNDDWKYKNNPIYVIPENNKYSMNFKADMFESYYRNDYEIF